VRHDGGSEEREERPYCCKRVSRVCALAEPARRDQGVMMVMGEWDQRSMAFHLVERTADGSAKIRLR
jgi:hypothetical protein